MTDFPTLDAITLPAANPNSLVLILHGYGADGRDLADLGQIWQQQLPQTAFIALNAPEPCEANPMGRQWFSLFDIAHSNRSGQLTYWPVEKILGGLRRASAILDHWITELAKQHNVPMHRIALAGFSQGCMLSLHNGLRQPQALAGIVGYSGRLLAPELLTSELRSKPPVFLRHGDADDIVPPASLGEAEAALRVLGLAVEAKMEPGLTHSISPEGVAEAGEFLKKSLTA
jgi:phospholipase/carboxylesterase